MTSLATADVCNHANQPASNFLATDQFLPDVVETIGASAVPSFAPSIVAVALTGLFVSASPSPAAVLTTKRKSNRWLKTTLPSAL